jgi:hypothetical protein
MDIFSKEDLSRYVLSKAQKGKIRLSLDGDI